MVLVGLSEAVLHKQIDDLRMGLDQTGDVRIVRGFHDTHPLVCRFELHLNLVCMAEHLGKQRISHVNWPASFHPFVHSSDVFLDLGCDLRVIRLGQCFHTVVSVGDLTTDLIMMLQQKMECTSIHGELFVVRRAAWPTSNTSSTSVAPPALGGQISGGCRDNRDRQT
jgi:hypothetical protein